MYIYEKIDITNYELTEHLPETILSNLVIFLLIKNILETVYIYIYIRFLQHKG